MCPLALAGEFSVAMVPISLLTAAGLGQADVHGPAGQAGTLACVRKNELGSHVHQQLMLLLLLQIEGVWHTAVVLGHTEHYYGQGLQSAPAGRTPFGTPVQVVDLGATHLPQDVIEDFLQVGCCTWSCMAPGLLEQVLTCISPLQEQRGIWYVCQGQLADRWQLLVLLRARCRAVGRAQPAVYASNDVCLVQDATGLLII